MMEKRQPTIVERVLHRDATARGVGELACDDLKPKDPPVDAIVAHFTVIRPDGPVLRFVELIPKEA